MNSKMLCFMKRWLIQFWMWNRSKPNCYMIQNRTSFGIGFAFFALGILLSHTYRHWIYANHINDFHIADTIGSLVCIPASVFFFYSFSRNKSSFRELIGKSTIAFIVYELIGLIGIHGVFDFYDIIAILLSAGSLYLFHSLYKMRIQRISK